VDRGEGRTYRRHGGVAVGQAERRQGRRAVGRSGDVREAGHRLGQGAEAGALAVGTELPEATDTSHHQAGIDRVQLLRA